MVENFVPRPRTRFLRLKCNSCSNVQTVFSAATTQVRCLVCNSLLAESGASKIRLNVKAVRVLE